MENSKAGKARGLSSQHNSLPLKCVGGREYWRGHTEPGNLETLLS